MPTAVIEIPANLNPPRKRWTRQECDVLCSTGIVDCQRLELFEGELIGKMPPPPRHGFSASRQLQGAMIVIGFDNALSEANIDVSSSHHTSSDHEYDLTHSSHY